MSLHAGPALHLDALGDLLALEDPQRLVVLHPDGSLLASTRLPIRRKRSDLLSGQPTPPPRSRIIAFAVMHPDRRIETQVFERGVETVYRVRPGMRAAVPVYTGRVRFNVCAHAANLSWHGSWLLYSASEGSKALIDTQRGQRISLSSPVRRLPGFKADGTGTLRVAWAQEIR